MQFFTCILLGFLVVCAISVSLSKNLLNSLLIYMSYSLVMSIIWILLESPDLAITEAAVGAGVTSILFFVTLKKIHAIADEDGDEAGDMAASANGDGSADKAADMVISGNDAVDDSEDMPVDGNANIEKNPALDAGTIEREKAAKTEKAEDMIGNRPGGRRRKE